MSEKLWSEKLIENEATSNVILSRREWDSLIEGIQSLESELESARRDRGIGWDKFVRRLEAISDRKRLEAEVAEIREKLASVEKDRDHWKANHDAQVRKNKILRERPDLPVERLEAYQAMEAELANANTAWAVLNETHQKQAEKLVAAEKERDNANRSLQKSRDDYKTIRNAMDVLWKDKHAILAELTDYKSSSQWAVTTPRMSKESAERYAELMVDHGYQGRTNWQAVPLHAPEDGPWVLCYQNCWGIWYRTPNAGESSSNNVDQAVQYLTRAEAARNASGTYYVPVRLSDVERESEHQNAKT